eukprot:gnl/Spiro4/12475_TR6587_c0_g1_i1.p1 gnl/Spiro4/12475_TR6587_c0_g1~~gnl/Spiro4/12475_TR6587_c0_g1_i1.p1  ORF type:complete len:278 (+),score=59.63 gnl/Spiro4/12475_TR6587_c0_g1_i1:45-836(+)
MLGRLARAFLPPLARRVSSFAPPTTTRTSRPTTRLAHSSGLLSTGFATVDPYKNRSFGIDSPEFYYLRNRGITRNPEDLELCPPLLFHFHGPQAWDDKITVRNKLVERPLDSMKMRMTIHMPQDDFGGDACDVFKVNDKMFYTDIDYCIIPGIDGNFQVNREMCPVEDVMRPGVVEWFKPDRKGVQVSVKYFVAGGWIFADKYTLHIYPFEAVPLDAFDVTDVKRLLAEAETKLQNAELPMDEATTAMVTREVYSALAQALGA